MSADPAPRDPVPDVPRCPCGFARDHFMVTAQMSYSAIGWLAFFVGITALPTRVTYRCRRCDGVVEYTEELAVREKHRA